MEPQLVQWIECSRCSKWRILPPGSVDPTAIDEDAEWYCEMNTDVLHNTCAAPEEEYKAPVLTVPSEAGVEYAAAGTVLLPLKKITKLNDADAIRSVLKSMPLAELETMYKALDVERLFREEFGPDLPTARDKDLVRSGGSTLPLMHRKNKASPSSGSFDLDSNKHEFRRLQQEGRNILHESISAQYTR